MDSKRKKYSELDEENYLDANKKKKHTLDSDEEDSDEYEREDDDNIDGDGEEGISNIRDDVKITPFNMREELEEGHFDKEGQYHWDKSNNEIRDNWLDNIDWVKVDESHVKKDEVPSSSTNNDLDEKRVYEHILSYMENNETVAQTIRRLGKSRKKLSTAERLKNKKLGIVDVEGDKIMKLTEMVNDILTTTGNMDVYEMTFACIEKKIKTLSCGSSKSSGDTGLDMYADDFTEREVTTKTQTTHTAKNDDASKEEKHIFWEFKWKQDDNELNGPYKTTEMLEMSKNGKLGNGVYVRKVGENTNFYTSNRIDFDLYL